MSTAIIGLAASGKTTLFNALTRGSVDKGTFGDLKSLNVGIGAKPDARLDHLNTIFKSRRKVRAEMTFWDVPVDYTTGTMLTPEMVNSLQKSKALLATVRYFDDPSIPHPDGSVDWLRDLEKVSFEILFADIALIDRRIERIETGMKAIKSSERGQAQANMAALKRIQSRLEDGLPLRSQSFDEAETRALSGSFMLSALPLVVAVNISEDSIGTTSDELRSHAVANLGETIVGSNVQIVPICGAIEEELRSLDDNEAAELRAALGTDTDDSEILMDACLECLSTRTFYTASDREVRAWHFADGATAPEAAGLVHSDMERGFIRAEIIAYDDFMRCGSMAEARKQGVLRQEGRNYIFADGDLANFLFSV